MGYTDRLVWTHLMSLMLLICDAHRHTVRWLMTCFLAFNGPLTYELGLFPCPFSVYHGPCWPATPGEIKRKIFHLVKLLISQLNFTLNSSGVTSIPYNDGGAPAVESPKIILYDCNTMNICIYVYFLSCSFTMGAFASLSLYRFGYIHITPLAFMIFGMVPFTSSHPLRGGGGVAVQVIMGFQISQGMCPMIATKYYFRVLFGFLAVFRFFLPPDGGGGTVQMNPKYISQLDHMTRAWP